MTPYRVYDHKNEEVLLPEQDPQEIKGFGYSTVKDTFEAIQRVYGSTDQLYEEEDVSIQELERIGWIDMEKLPSKREIISMLGDNSELRTLEDNLEDYNI